MDALAKAELLDGMNSARRAEQDRIFKEASTEAEKYKYDPVLVVSGKNWSHGIIGIVAAKLLEKYKKPTFVLEVMGEESKGSARSYGDFSAADAIRAADDLITKGGGHKLAAGLTMPTAVIGLFRKRVNEYYHSLDLSSQPPLLLPREDITVADLSEIDEKLIEDLAQLEPFGNGNPEPIMRIQNALVINMRRMGAEGQHVKVEVRDSANRHMQMLAFNAEPHWFVEPGEYVSIWFQPTLNEWNGSRTVEGRIMRLEHTEIVDS